MDYVLNELNSIEHYAIALTPGSVQNNIITVAVIVAYDFDITSIGKSVDRISNQMTANKLL